MLKDQVPPNRGTFSVFLKVLVAFAEFHGIMNSSGKTTLEKERTMRLWHKDLISVLPRQQLLGQWRECCAIMANIAKNGTPNNVLVNKVMDYKLEHLYRYSSCVVYEMLQRGYRYQWNKFESHYCKVEHSADVSHIERQFIYDGWMNDRYLLQCYYNLQEKYDCGAITEEEWQKIDEKFKLLVEN